MNTTLNCICNKPSGPRVGTILPAQRQTTVQARSCKKHDLLPGHVTSHALPYRLTSYLHHQNCKWFIVQRCSD